MATGYFHKCTIISRITERSFMADVKTGGKYVIFDQIARSYGCKGHSVPVTNLKINSNYLLSFADNFQQFQKRKFFNT